MMTASSSSILSASGISIPTQPFECGHFIGGKLRSGKGKGDQGLFREVISPYLGTSIGTFQDCTPEELDEAVQLASAASRVWRAIPLKERTQVLFRFREKLLQYQDEMARVISLESGKTPAEARAGLMKGVEVLEFAISLQNLNLGGRMEVSRGVSCEVRREPLGVVAGITPFNFPAMVPLWMIPNAIALGNSFIWKPSDKTPLTSVWIARALQEAGLPDGVFSVVQGGKETVEGILKHPGISAVGFVGSTPVARSIYQKGASQGKRVLALGGAKNHLILMPDAQPELSSQAIADSFTGCAGQRCMAASVLVAVGKVDAIVDQVLSCARAIRPGVNMGAIISRESLERLEAALQDAVKAGAKLLLDGRRPSVPDEYSQGFWLGPTILDQVKPGSVAACSELFGPVLSIIRCETLSEAIEISNSGKFGNATSVFTSSGAVAERVAREAHAGMIGVNVGVPVPREPFSFGGTQESKFGHGDITGESSIEFWTSLKKVTTKWVANSDKTWLN